MSATMDPIRVWGGPLDGAVFTPPVGATTPIYLYPGRLPMAGREDTSLVLSPRPVVREGHGRDYYRLASVEVFGGALAYLWCALEYSPEPEWVKPGEVAQ